MFNFHVAIRNVSILKVVGSKNSCGLSVIEFQEAAEALASLYIP